jgi:hypothetical protein
MTLVCKNPVPVTVSVTAVEPAFRVAGLMDDTDGAEGLLFAVEGALDAAPPHPLAKTTVAAPTTKARKRTDNSATLRTPETRIGTLLLGTDCSFGGEAVFEI